MNLEEIKAFWEQAGQQIEESDRISPTSRDPYLGQLERENVLSFLGGRKRVLEIGCGDGAHTLHYARCVQKLSAMDVADSLIELAKKRMADHQTTPVDFRVGSVLNLSSVYGQDQFDCIITQRCLINLPEWENQQEAIKEVHKVLEPGGLFLLTEGFEEELNHLNKVRKSVHLPEIKVVPYNKNIVRKNFESFIRPYFDTLEIRDYGTYLFLSRVFHPLAVLPDNPQHDSPLNKAAFELSHALTIPQFQEYSYNLFYVLKKR